MSADTQPGQDSTGTSSGPGSNKSAGSESTGGDGGRGGSGDAYAGGGQNSASAGDASSGSGGSGAGDGGGGGPGGGSGGNKNSGTNFGAGPDEAGWDLGDDSAQSSNQPLTSSTASDASQQQNATASQTALVPGASRGQSTGRSTSNSGLSRSPAGGTESTQADSVVEGADTARFDYGPAPSTSGGNRTRSSEVQPSRSTPEEDATESLAGKIDPLVAFMLALVLLVARLATVKGGLKDRLRLPESLQTWFTQTAVRPQRSRAR